MKPKHNWSASPKRSLTNPVIEEYRFEIID